jgi:ribosomal protein S12 methylthiotransferase
MPATVHFVSLGCPKNRVDTEVMLGHTADAATRWSPTAAAEVIVVNTCGFIGEAKQESIDAILEMAQYKEAGSCRKLVVAGCLTQRYPKELAEELREVDHFLGTDEVARWPTPSAAAPSACTWPRRRATCTTICSRAARRWRCTPPT